VVARPKFRFWRSPLTWLVILSLACLLSFLIPILRFAYYETKGPFSHHAEAVDLDMDGDLDIIMAGARFETETTVWAGVRLWINHGGGRFAVQNAELPGGFAAAVTDVDRDGDPDLLVYNGLEATLALNQGGAQGGEAGNFVINNPIRPSQDWQGWVEPRGSISLGDLNGDSQTDGFISGCCSLAGQTLDDPTWRSPLPAHAWTWINDWDARGWLERHAVPLEELNNVPIRAAALGDLDGDGDLDVYAAVGAPDLDQDAAAADRVLLNDGAGNLSDSGQRLGDADSTAAALGDLDGDGDLDALVGTRAGVELLLNRGDGQLASAGLVLPGPETADLFVRDFDLDGDLDALAVGKRQTDLWLNDGRAGWQSAGIFIQYKESTGIAVGDFNGDGLEDLFAAEAGGKYTLWLNQGDGSFAPLN